MSQNIIYGIEHLDQLYSKLSPKSVLLVCDSSFKYLPYSIKNIYNNHKENTFVFDSFTPNPLYEQVYEGVRMLNDTHCDMIIAVGGGSSIDVAKCIKLFCKMDDSINYLEQEFTNSDIPLIAIPTTAGTGSESTRYAVIYYNGVKQSISHPSIIPNYAILEPSVLKTLPTYQKKCTMLDALCQAIESWWSVNSTDESQNFSRMAVTAIKENWKKYINENNEIAAEKIMCAANYAGQAISITATTAAHAMSYKITSMYGLPHGHAVALCMLKVWEYLLNHFDKCIDTRGETYLRNIITALPVDIDWFRALFAKLIMTYPSSANKKNELDILVSSVNAERMKNFPVLLDEMSIKNMYNNIIGRKI